MDKKPSKCGVPSTEKGATLSNASVVLLLRILVLAAHGERARLDAWFPARLLTVPRNVDKIGMVDTPGCGAVLSVCQYTITQCKSLLTTCLIVRVVVLVCVPLVLLLARDLHQCCRFGGGFLLCSVNTDRHNIRKGCRAGDVSRRRWELV